MSILNTESWTPPEVARWMGGLHANISGYASTFLQKGVTGQLLLNLMAGDLQKYGVKKVGDQLLIQEAIQALRAELDTPRTTLQTLSSALSIRCRNYRSELSNLKTRKNYIPTESLSSASYLLDSAKNVIRWLTRFPFLHNYDEVTVKLIQHCFELAMLSQRDSFADNAIEEVQYLCTKIIEICEGIVGSRDSLVIQPALVDVVSLNKAKGFLMQSNNNTSYNTAELVHLNASNLITRSGPNLEKYDEILQVNEKTVISWPSENIKQLIQQSQEKKDLFLTVKRRPRHATAHIMAHTHLKPIKQNKSNNNNDTKIQPMISPVMEEEPVIDNKNMEMLKLFETKSRSQIKRRATVTGASPTETRPPVTFFNDKVNRPPLINSKSAPDKILIKQGRINKDNTEIMYSSVLHLRDSGVSRPPTRWTRTTGVFYKNSVFKFGKMCVESKDCTFSVATEVHSRPFAFKVVLNKAVAMETYYLAAESHLEFLEWGKVLGVIEDIKKTRAPYKRSVSLGGGGGGGSCGTSPSRVSQGGQKRISRQFSRSISQSSKSAWFNQSQSSLSANRHQESNISSITISSSLKAEKKVEERCRVCSAKFSVADAQTQTEELLLVLNHDEESCV